MKHKTASANLFIKMLREKSKEMDLDKSELAMLKKLVSETKDLIDEA